MNEARPDDARSTCANCDSPLIGPFCAACGQKDLGTRVTLWELVREVVSESFEVEGRLPRTLWSIALRPGEYLGEYLDGKRKSYASPFRFYLVMVFVAAVVMGWRGQTYASAIGGVNIEQGAAGTNLTFVAKDDLVEAPSEFEAFPLAARPQADDRCTELLPCFPTSPLTASTGVDWIASMRSDRSLQCYSDGPEHVFRQLAILGPEHAYLVLYRGWVQQLPVLMGTMLFGLALVLKALWPRSSGTVAVVTSMVMHALALIALVVVVTLARLWVMAPVGVWLGAHLAYGLKRAYGSGWPRTLSSSVIAVFGWIAAFALGAVFGGYRLMMDLIAVAL